MDRQRIALDFSQAQIAGRPILLKKQLFCLNRGKHLFK